MAHVRGIQSLRSFIFLQKKKKIQLKIFLDIPWFLVHMVSWGTLALWSLQVLGWGLAVICKLG